ncbi:hypothetical protein [Flavobacterium sp. JP2137]|uniref:hypothetical protein n=1 Tax=Flavobacterium sp. JP2137 TaxID=3414510 RepID=UPI003D2FDE53
MSKPLIFTNWMARCSSLGNLMTNLPTEDEQAKIALEIEELTNERDYGTNRNGNKVKWTETKDLRLGVLIKKRDNPDELPSGAITYLEKEFRDKFWRRRRFLDNKYLSKGTINEDDSLGLLSLLDNFFYRKNDEHLNNGTIQGTPDNRQNKTKDTKSSWDLETFENAELISLYSWQLKGYMWLEHSYDNPELNTKTEAELCYCLVNAPLHLIENEKKSLWFKMGMPDEDSETWINAVCQLERNMIFDIPAFQAEYPNYDFYNPVLDFSIPPHLRDKRFSVNLESEDIKNITRRVLMARDWLIAKEIETLKLIEHGKTN